MKSEPDPAEMAARYGGERPSPTGASVSSAPAAAAGRSIWKRGRKARVPVLDPAAENVASHATRSFILPPTREQLMAGSAKKARSLTWDRFKAMLERFPLPLPRITHPWAAPTA